MKEGGRARRSSEAGNEEKKKAVTGFDPEVFVRW